MGLEKEAAVIIISAVLGDDLNLCATVAPIFCIVVIRDDLDFLDRVFVRSDDGRPAPGDTGDSYAVDLVVVTARSRAICGDLSTVFDFENTVRATTAALR